jgi:hypothetical protein
MRFKNCVTILCLSVLALGQSPGQSSIQTLRGIKIVSSNYDPNTRTVQLDFINDTSSNITAWAYCVTAQKVADSDPYQGFCTLGDPTALVIDRQVQEQLTLRPIMGDSPDGHFVHPGEHKILSQHFSLPVAGAEIRVNMLIYSDGTTEMDGEFGEGAAKGIASGRRASLNQAQELAALGKKVLADQSDQHPAQTMIKDLQSRVQNEPDLPTKANLQTTLDNFKKPEWRKANAAEFVPTDERGYLARFVKEHEMIATELAKYQLGVN